MNCNICERDKELRLGTCWDCATAESIIADGKDMYEKGLDGSETPAKTAMEKVKLLIQKKAIY